MLPNLVIVGVVKSGTTSVHRYLSTLPSVYGSEVKETCYFLPIRYGEKIDPIGHYKNYFSKADGLNYKYVFESTPGYFHGGVKLAGEIKKVNDCCKIIIILRDPVERLISFFNYKKSQLELDANLTLSDYISTCQKLSKAELRENKNDMFYGVEGSLYNDMLLEWVSCFGSQNILVYNFDDLQASPKEFMNKMCVDLSLNENFNDFNFTVENKTRNVKSRGMHKAALKVNKFLETFFHNNPSLKRTLRNVYFYFNESDSSSVSIGDDLMDIFASDVLKLKETLTQHGYNLPDWVSKYE